jgi:hypothetical protein
MLNYPFSLDRPKYTPWRRKRSRRRRRRQQNIFIPNSGAGSIGQK